MRAPRPAEPPIAVEIHALAAGGDAVGRDESGRAVFVAGAVPGEHVQVQVTETHARWARGELVRVTRPAPTRVEPPCPLFAARACGGCQWQHVHDAVQHAQKLHIVMGAVRKLVAAGMELRPLLTPVAPYRWRRRARFAVRGGGGGGGGGVVIGFHEPRGRGVCDVAACPQLEPALEEVLRVVRAAKVVTGDGEGRGEGEGEVHVVVGDGGAHVVIDAPCDANAAAGLVGQAGIAGVAWRGGRAGARGRASAPTWSPVGGGGGGGGEGATWDASRGAAAWGTAGAAGIEIEPGLVVRGDGFAQASRAGNDALRELVRAAVAPRAGERVLELYAGGGNFTRDLIAAGAAVVASDVEAREGAGAGAGAAAFVVGAAESVMRDLVARGERFDVVLLDPPRTGAREVVTRIAALGAKRVVYVSCDPATFARDAEHLVAAGYAPRWAQPLDLMPQTSHVELVARFERT